MKRSLLLIVPFMAVALMFSCKKEEGSHNTVTPGGYKSMDDLFAATAHTPTTQSIKVSTGGEIISKGGTHILFPPNAFQSYNGAIITGSVDVKVNDWVRKGDMVFGKVLPVSNNQALTTSGQAYIEATQNGVPVRLRKGYRVILKFPQLNVFSTGDSLYLGRAVAGSVNTVNWYTNDTGGVSNVVADTAYLTSDSLRYIASSHYLNPSDHANFTVRVDAPISLEQTVAVALLDGVRCVYPVSSAINNTIWAEHIPAMPLRVAVMGITKGVFYGGIVQVENPKTDSVWTVTMKEVAPQNFRLQMNALP
jgi:hypothetical protein